MTPTDLLNAAMNAQNIHAFVSYHPHVNWLQVRIHPADRDYQADVDVPALYDNWVQLGDLAADTGLRGMHAAIVHLNAEAAQ